MCWYPPTVLGNFAAPQAQAIASTASASKALSSLSGVHQILPHIRLIVLPNNALITFNVCCPAIADGVKSSNNDTPARPEPQCAAAYMYVCVLWLISSCWLIPCR